MAEEEKKQETFSFQAETKQLLDLMIHSIYTNHEIFLRELISNASDAIDKLRFASLTNAELLEGDKDFTIRLTPDAAAHTLTIADNGIGMNHDELVKNIGTIAQSGTKEFLRKLEEANKLAKEAGDEAHKEGGKDTTDRDLIGQFGVGFYSAFMVADKVVIRTRKAGEQQGWKWESAADGTYTIEPADVAHHGTQITLYLGEAYAGEGAEQDMTSYWTLEGLVKKYSDFIRYPIKMEETLEEPGKNEKGEIDEKAPTVKKVEDRTLNSMTPLWKRNKSSIKPEDTTSSSSTSSTNGKTPCATTTRTPKAPSSTRPCCTFRAKRRPTFISRNTNRACSSTPARSSSWINARTCCRTTCASSKALSTRPTCP